MTVLVYLILAGIFLTNIRKPMGQMTVKEQRLEGEYRYINSRLITNSEEIAFYHGNNREKLTMLTSFHKLVSLFELMNQSSCSIFKLNFTSLYSVKVKF